MPNMPTCDCLSSLNNPTIIEAWVQGQRNSGRQPTTEEAMRGEQIFMAGPCSMCHQVRGTLAGGRVAPDLDAHRQPPETSLPIHIPITTPISKRGSLTLNL